MFWQLTCTQTRMLIIVTKRLKLRDWLKCCVARKDFEMHKERKALLYSGFINTAAETFHGIVVNTPESAQNMKKCIFCFLHLITTNQ